MDEHHAFDRGPDPTPGKDVELKLVDQLVLENVIEIFVRAGEGQHHPMSYRIGNTLHALGDVGQVVLLKLRVRCKQDDRLPFPVFVMQRPRQARVCPFRHTRRVHGRVAEVVVVVNVEVCRLDDQEIEAAIPDAILSEVLCLCGGGQQKEGKEDEEDRPASVHPCDSIMADGASPQSRSSW